MTPRSETDAERFRKEAQECRELAEKAENALDKEAWLLLAEDWLKLAREAEGAPYIVGDNLWLNICLGERCRMVDNMGNEATLLSTRF
jgi:hypothetical protein